MIRIGEKWVSSYKDEEVFPGETFDIFLNPGSKDWQKINFQSRRYKIPVRFLFMETGNIYVGAVVFHADLSGIAHEREGLGVRGVIDGVINTAENVYSFQTMRASEEHIEMFKDTLFYRRVLRHMEHSDHGVPEMANEVH